jgi:hypothetical protein
MSEKNIEVSHSDANSGFFCDLTTLQAIERQRRCELANAVGRATRKRIELPNGYALELDAHKITIAAVTEWMALEKRCCPFLNFQVLTDSLSEALTVELTGADGVKEFLRAELTR